MRYYAEYDSEGNLIAIGTGECGGVEITEEEYNAILSELQLKNEYVTKVYLQQITLDEVPEVYRSEIEKRVRILILEKEKELAESEGDSNVNYNELAVAIQEGVNEV